MAVSSGCSESWELAPDKVFCQVLPHVEDTLCLLGVPGCPKSCPDILVGGSDITAAAVGSRNSRAGCGSFGFQGLCFTSGGARSWGNWLFSERYQGWYWPIGRWPRVVGHGTQADLGKASTLSKGLPGKDVSPRGWLFGLWFPELVSIGCWVFKPPKLIACREVFKWSLSVPVSSW